ncbi:MAG: 3'-5' exonuclease [Alkalispirochaeta sp.]
MNKVIYLDVETSGTDPARHSVVQVAWITEIDDEVWSENSLLVQPPLDAEIDPAAMAVHGITQADLNERGVSVSRAVEAMKADWDQVIDKWDRRDKAVLCAYNLRFDFEFLKAAFEHAGDRYLGSWIQFGRWLDPLYLASFAQYTGVMARTMDLKLTTIAEELGIPADYAHDALADIRMTRRVLRELRVRFATQGDDRDD